MTEQPRTAAVHSMPMLLLQCFQALIDELVGGLRTSGYADLRVAHSRVFEHLPAAGARVTQLAEDAQMTQQSMSELVDYLEARGYVERKQDPRDRRARLVMPTAKGRRALKRAREISGRIESRWDAMLGRRRAATLRACLEDIARTSGRLPSRDS
jgi:DNA-binding MarR family transcriptional regulator